MAERCQRRPTSWSAVKPRRLTSMPKPPEGDSRAPDRPAALPPDKSGLRREIKTRLSRLSSQTRAEGSARACDLLMAQELWKKAGSILCYAAIQEELDVRALIAAGLRSGKRVALPRYDQGTNTYCAAEISDPPADLVTGRYGILEPGGHCIARPLNRLDLILVPGVAFDLQGRRLGRGKGFYDRLLAAVLGTTCGVAFDEQIVVAVPVEPHDSDVNCILTPTRWIEL